MIIEYDTILYRTVLDNIVKSRKHGESTRELFLEEIEKYGGVIEYTDEKYIRYVEFSVFYSHDTLGMNHFKLIRFTDEHKYLLFRLMWS